MTRRVATAIAIVVALVAIAISARPIVSRLRPRSATRSGGLDADRESAYRANNVGVALLEQFNYPDAAAEFQRALQIRPDLTLARVNLAIALLYQPDLDAAQREAAAVAERLPDDPRPQYVLGLIARERGETDVAAAAFQRVLRRDPHDVGSHVNLGQILLQQQRYREAIAQFRAALADEPYNVTAAYNLGLALTRTGDRDEGQKAMQRSQVLRNAGYGVTYGAGYLQQGKYAEAVASTGAERDLVDPNLPDVAFASVAIDRSAEKQPAAGAMTPFGRQFGPGDTANHAQEIVRSLGGGLTLLDYDGDGDLDLAIASADGVRLLRNDGGRFVDVTHDARLDSPSLRDATGIVAGDFDNDGRPDLLVLRYGGNTLLHNDGGRFTDVTSRSRLPAYPFLSASAAFVDFDHDGDLDIVIAGLADLAGSKRTRPTPADLGGSETTRPAQTIFPDGFPGAPLQFVRNNGDGTFADITQQTGISEPVHAVAVVATDYDNDRAVDLLVGRYDAPPMLLKNLRDGTFRDVAADAGLDEVGGVTSLAIADVSKDGYPDFFFGRVDGDGAFAISDRGSRFRVTGVAGSARTEAAQFVDYDNDGLVDLLLWTNGGPRLLRTVGERWTDATSRTVAGARTSPPTSPRGVVVADLDGDGDADVVLLNPGATLWRNNGGSRNKSLRVQLAGRASNRLGVGSKIEMRAGSLSQRFETSASTPASAPATLTFGLGDRDGADAVRVLWPSGILQSEIAERRAAGPGMLPAHVRLEELDRKPSSCPFLYTWNGTRFEFVTDFMGGGEMGYWEAPGVRNRVDPEEYVRIRGDQLVAKDGRYELRVTNELEEAVFVDRIQLVVIEHPDDVEVFPNEGMTDPPKPFRIFAARHPHPPDHVVDDYGHDVTDRVARLDGRYPDDFALNATRGYAEPHTLTIDVGSELPDFLLLTGWTDYAFSSDNVAAQQRGLALQPPVLEALTQDGTWHLVADDVGIPVGRPQTIVVDLRGRLSGATAIRLRTNMRIYWDQIAVAAAADVGALELKRLDPISASLRVRGFSAEIAATPPKPITYDYSRVTRSSPWKTMVGAYTRVGDVTPLLHAADDRFVIAAPGDEIALSFDASSPAPPRGRKQTFLLFADGFSKEMDVNSASPEFVEPLPFHGMSAYPYGPAEHYPDTPAHRRYRQEYNTRHISTPIFSLDRFLRDADHRGDPASAGFPSSGSSNSGSSDAHIAPGHRKP